MTQQQDTQNVIELPDRIGRTKQTYRSAFEILTKASGFMDSYDHTLNPYSSCSFGCSYCYAAFFSKNQQLQDTWGLWVNAKENAGRLIAKLQPHELDGRRIYMSSVTDPYQPIEKKVEITREILEQMACRHAPKLVVQTRSPLVTRDIGLMQQIVDRGGRVQVNMTVTTDDESVRKTFEPGCPGNPARLKAIAQVQAAGIQSCITLTPLLLVRDVDSFADSLIQTGVERFIIQSFRFQRGGFIAQTRQQAFSVMSGKLGLPAGTPLSEFTGRCLERYREARDALAERLPQLGEGRQGFMPPF